MQAKGQLFATDFLIAMSIIILGFGMLGALSEFDMYQNKEASNYNELQEKAETAAITLANAGWANCAVGDVNLAYSINIKSDQTLSSDDIKNLLGLKGYAANITVGGNSYGNVTDPTAGLQNVAVVDLNVLTCQTNNIPFADFKDCLNSGVNGPNCKTGPNKVNKQVLHVEVGK